MSVNMSSLQPVWLLLRLCFLGVVGSFVLGLGGVATAETALQQVSSLQLTVPLQGQDIGGHITRLEDAGKQLDIADIRSPQWAGQFKALQGQHTALGLSHSAWWVKLTVDNPTSEPVDWLLESTFPHTDYLDLYHFSSGQLAQHEKLGDLRPFANRPITAESFVVPITTPAEGESLIYIRLAHAQGGMIDTQLRVWSPPVFQLHRESLGIVKGVFYGGLLFMAIYNLFIYFSTRMREYFWYVVYITLVFGSSFGMLGLGHRYIWAESGFLTNTLHIILLSCMFLSLTQFSRSFLKTAHSLPRVDRLLLAMMVTALLVVVLTLVGYKLIASKLLISLGIIVVILPFIGALSWYKGMQRARFFTVGWIIAASFHSLTLGWWMGLSDSQFYTDWAGRMGLWLEAVFFSLALADHINILRREQEQAIAREQQALRQTKDELEVQVAARTEDLAKAKQQADQASEAKSLFLATMSHEIRTPINGILGMSHLALSTLLTEQQRDYLNKIRISTGYLLDIVNNILDFSKIEADRLEIEQIVFSLDEVLENLSSLFAEKARSRHLEYHVLIAPQIPPLLIGDPLRLKQILANLIGNAIKFTESGRVDVEIQWLAERADAVELRFIIRDSGIGMSTAQQESLFQAFSQADASTTRKYGGSGLGLSISQRLVAQMGSEISVVSEPGQGSLFSFALTLGLPQGQEGSLARYALSSGQPAPQFEPASILLVEDNPINQQVAQELLHRVGLSVEIANHGQEAVTKAMASRYDLILMDIEMPIMDGYQATAQIRAITPCGEVPIIAMTAHAQPEDQERCLAAGMHDHIPKPVEPEQLYRTLSRWLLCHASEKSPSEPAQKVDFASIPSQLPGIDLARGLRVIDQNHRLFAKLLREFYADYHQAGERLKSLMAAGEQSQAQALCHTLKGAAGQLGAGELAQAASQLEHRFRGGEDATSLLAAFEQALGEVMEGLEKWHLEEQKAGTQGEQGHRVDELGPLFERLQRYLAEASPQAVELMPMIRQILGAGEHPWIDRLEQHVDHYQYEQAEEVLAQVVLQLQQGGSRPEVVS
uniref:Sensory/regulatory protein RpfC n=1 Tax=Magnetococcus massalia (strain MO-1) TaxID=451514 RepID=A0A1S7LLU4_MAGMO|nr:putative Histidine kinase. Containing 7TMR-DISM extracellular 2, 7TM diverse intracellular signalling, HisKA, HATPase_c, Response regulator receiver domain and Hpt domain [Candidatus Magnetococcus massalia]